MKIYCEANRNLSWAMYRVANALKTHAPAGIKFVASPAGADLEILHVIGTDVLSYESQAREFAIIQYCGSKLDASVWHPVWARAATVWSYYDLAAQMPAGASFYHAPLGVDASFINHRSKVFNFERPIGVVTSGYVTGATAEAIEETAWAASFAGLSCTHIGPSPDGAQRPFPAGWRSLLGLSDAALADVYQQARWVSGLRHVEGFELPVLEGLVLGARPIVFDRPDMRQWYTGHAVFVPEGSGADLINPLIQIFQKEPLPVTARERRAVLEKFDWARIVTGFWKTVLNRKGVYV